MMRYRPVTTDSNLEPLTIELTRDGQLVPLDGASGSITIKDQRTGNVLVDAEPVQITDPGKASYVLPRALVQKIAREGTWLVEWYIETSSGDLAWRSEPIELPVRAKVSSRLT